MNRVSLLYVRLIIIKGENHKGNLTLETGDLLRDY
jgi:hypothetical protein